MVGLHILKHMFDLSDEEVCERWVYDPYFQCFCGEEYFQHELPMERSSMTRWRDRIGPEGLEKVFQESLAVAHRVGALREKDLERVTVDTTVQEKAIAFPTAAKLMQRARERLVRLAREHGIALRQSYIFCIPANRMVLLHGFIKKTRKTPPREIGIARKRMKEVREHD